MIKIAICDNEKDICNDVESIILNYCSDNNIKVETSIFYSAEKLLEHVKKSNAFDLVFLDIEMDQLSGIDFGNLMRSDFPDEDIRIVYISWQQGYAMDLFRIRPYHFLVKPIEEHRTDIEKIINDVNDVLIKDKQFFHYQVGKNFGKEHYADILYFSSENRIIKLHTVEEVISFYDKLDTVEKNIEGTVFLRVHKSLLINTRHVKKFDVKTAYLDNGEELEISKRYSKNVNKFIMNNWGG